MLIDNTSDKIQFKLSGAVTTNQLPFTIDYNNYTASAVTPISASGVSNDTTVVDLVPSPAGSEQNQVRGMSIYNADTVSATVIMILFDGTNSRTFYQATLAVGDTLYYENERGFYIIAANGSERTAGYRIIRNSINMKEAFMAANTSTSLVMSNTTVQFLYLGRAEKAYTSMSFAYNVTTAITATIAWAELLVYTSPPGVMGKAQNFTLKGFTDCSAIWNTNTRKITAVTVSGINPGDDIWVALSVSTSGTVPNFRSGVTDSSVILGVQQLSAALGVQPSLQDNLIVNATQNGVGNVWLGWQGT